MKTVNVKQISKRKQAFAGSDSVLDVRFAAQINRLLLRSYSPTKMRSPTARTKRYLEKQGYTVEVVGIDIVSIQDRRGGDNDLRIVAIQSTSGSNHNARVRKAFAEPKLKQWLKSGALFEVWSWSRKGARGKRKMWQRRVEVFLLFHGEVRRSGDVCLASPYWKAGRATEQLIVRNGQVVAP